MSRGVVQELAAVAGMDAAIQRVVQLARERLGMDVAWVSHIQDGRLVVETLSGGLPGTPIGVGAAVQAEETYCHWALSGDIPPVVPDTQLNDVTRDMPVTAALGIRSYMGVPIRTGTGLVYGTLCCGSTSPRLDLRQRDLDILAMLAVLIEQSIEEKAQVQAGRREGAIRIRRVLDAGGPDMVYQAIHCLPSQEVVGYEALARFPPDLPGPAEWFAAASDVGLDVELQLAAVQRAITALDVLPAHTWLAINLSPVAILSDQLSALIPPHHAARIVIEMTEHEQVSDYAGLRTAMARLRRLGIRFAADDAGSGYAGMRHLIEIRPDLIKMDYHLTHDIDADPARAAMATALHAFAAATSTVLLAEGVETEDELRAVVDVGITLAQGYHLGRPTDLQTIRRTTEEQAVWRHSSLAR